MHVEEEQLVGWELANGSDLDLTQDAAQRRHLASALRRPEHVENGGEGRVDGPRQRLPRQLVPRRERSRAASLSASWRTVLVSSRPPADSPSDQQMRRLRPASLAASSEMAVAAISASASCASLGKAATPSETVMRGSPVPSSACATVRRRSSARVAAPVRSVSGKSTANVSPPKRASTSPSAG